jgi:hypothetical protein
LINNLSKLVTNWGKTSKSPGLMVVYLFVVFSFGGGIAYDEGFTIFLISFKHISLFNHSDKRAVVVVVVC